VRLNFTPFNLNILLLGVPKRKHLTGEWRKLLHNWYSSPGHVARLGEGTKVCKVLVGKPEGKRPLGIPRRRREDGIRTDFRETGGGGWYWIRLELCRQLYAYITSSFGT
jgi:hypothetical protein